MLPNFINIGTAKSASTWLWCVFKEHPEIYVPFEKVVNFSGQATEADNVNYWIGDRDRGLQWYEQTYFSKYRDEKAIGEFSNGYLINERAIAAICKELPDVKLTVILRNPVERAFIHFMHHKNHDLHPESYTFNHLLDIHSWPFYQMFIETGYYHMHLMRVLRYFDRERILILFYDDIAGNERSFLKQVYGFLGVREEYQLPSIWNVVGWPRPDRADTKHGDLRAGVPEAIGQRLLSHYYEDTSRLEELTGRDLGAWKRLPCFGSQDQAWGGRRPPAQTSGVPVGGG